MPLFDTSLIKGNNTRISLAVVGGLVPAIGIFTFGNFWQTGSNAGSTVQGRPASWFFAFAWSIVVVAIALIMVLCSFNIVSLAPLVAVFVLVLLFASMAILWLYVFNQKDDKGSAAQVLASCVLLSLLIFAVLSTTKYQDDDENVTTKTTVSTLSTLPLTWCILH